MTLKSHGGGEYRSCFFSSEKEGFGLQGAEKRGAALQSPSPRSSAFLISIIMVDLDSLVTLYISATSRWFLRHTDQHIFFPEPPLAGVQVLRGCSGTRTSPRPSRISTSVEGVTTSCSAPEAVSERRKEQHRSRQLISW